MAWIIPSTWIRKCSRVSHDHLIILISLPEGRLSLKNVGWCFQMPLGWGLVLGCSKWVSYCPQCHAYTLHSSAPLELPWRATFSWGPLQTISLEIVSCRGSLEDKGQILHPCFGGKSGDWLNLKVRWYGIQRGSSPGSMDLNVGEKYLELAINR